MSDKSAVDFLKAIAEMEITHADRAVALLWWYDVEKEGIFKTPREIADEIELAGYGKQNPTRLASQLAKSKLTRKGPKGTFGIKVSSKAQLITVYRPYVNHVPVPESDSVVPRELFEGTRGYIEKVVRQINASYDSGLYDCCAVMCRRLLETLIIEAYEAKGWAVDLKGGDDQFMMFSGLLNKIENDKRFNLGRSAIRGLKDFKKLGDQSAHNRKFNARKSDIDRVRDGLRDASEPLLHEAGLI